MKRAYSPREIASRRSRALLLPERWRATFGEPEANALWFVSGPSASGKSSFVMQLAKELCAAGRVLYLSYEEGIGRTFQQRLEYLNMCETEGRLRVAVSDTFDELIERLSKRRSADFVIVDSLQQSGFKYSECEALRRRFPQKGFVFVSMEQNGKPMGTGALKLRYLADMKIRVLGYQAYCLGRTGGEEQAFTVWENGIINTTNNI